MNDLILRNTLILPAIFLHSLSHCTSHERLSSRWIPKYFIEFTYSTGALLMVTFTWFCKFEFFPTNITADLSAFIPRRLLIYQRIAEWRAPCKLIITSCTLESKEYMIVSSAKILQFSFWTCCGKSFTYSRNNKDPKIEPCGTPMVHGRDSDVTLFTRTHWRRSCK